VLIDPDMITAATAVVTASETRENLMTSSCVGDRGQPHTGGEPAVNSALTTVEFEPA
jgi:hypothetical protein